MKTDHGTPITIRDLCLSKELAASSPQGKEGVFLLPVSVESLFAWQSFSQAERASLLGNMRASLKGRIEKIGPSPDAGYFAPHTARDLLNSA